MGEVCLPLKLFVLLASLTLVCAKSVVNSASASASASAVDAASRTRNEFRKHHSHKWDHLTFTQQWPATACIAAGHHHRCVIPEAVSTWTIHGLWPTLKHTRGPYFCNHTWHFNEAEIGDLEPEMEVSWPNLFAESPLTSLWKHEWTKHGTCAASLPALRGEHNYFRKSLDLREKYPIGVLLSKSAIYARSEPKGYNLSDISAALRNQLQGKVVSIQCFFASSSSSLSSSSSSSSFHSTRQYLYQVEICLNKQFDPIDCPDAGTCSLNRPIYYPPIRKRSPSFSLFDILDRAKSPYLVL